MFTLSVLQYNSRRSQRGTPPSNRPRRSAIVDRNSKLIASDLETKTLYINRDLLENEAQVALKLSEVTGIPYGQIYDRLTNRALRGKYILLKRHVFPKEENRIRQLPIASIVFEDSLLRYYPHNNLFSHAVGYLNAEGDGVLGLEEYYDNYLKNTAAGQLKTTLDVRIQSAARDELQKAVKQYRPNFAVAIVEEIETGNILALVSLPDFNPNDSGDRLNTFNHASYGNYELGSILKIFTIANGLELGLIDENSTFDVTQNMRYGKFLIGDIDFIKNKGALRTGEVLAFSSNIGIAMIAKKIGIKRQLEFFENIGLLERLDTDLRQVSLPLQPRKWKDINLITIAYGYGIAISPLQALSAMGGVIGGHVLPPRFSCNYNSPKKMRKISRGTFTPIRNFLRLAVVNGTGKLAYIDGYDLGGKTGTARKIVAGAYQRGAHLASFFGAWPMENPKYSLIVVLDRPRESPEKDMDGTGGSVATVVAKNIILRITPFLEMLTN
ncbi:MAG: penicillin-binding protein 2 [Rickettsiales bacterium]|nr:penicillin-binding protein 2 [Rickettsiales bacterium]